MARESSGGKRRNRRLGLLFLLLVLVVVGAGVGVMVVDVGPRADGPNLVIDVDADVTPAGTPKTSATPVDPGPSRSTTLVPPDRSTTPVTPTDSEGTTVPTPATTPPTTQTPSGPNPPTGPGETPTDTPRSTTTPGDDLFDLGFDGDTVILDAAGVEPGDRGRESVTLANTGSVTGNLSIRDISARDRENGLTGAEATVDNSPASGELSTQLRLRISVTYPNGTTVSLFGTGDEPRTVADLASVRGRSAQGPLAPGERATVTVEWFLPSAAGNAIQGDSVSIDVAFALRSEE